MTIASKKSCSPKTKLIKAPRLQGIKKEFKGNEIIHGVFQNLYGESGGESFWKVLQWRFSINQQRGIKASEKYSVQVLDATHLLQEEDDYIVWLGHASWLIQINRKKILTDPCLTAPPFVKRRTKLPIPIEAIKPDYLLVSHGHFDHLDSKTLQYCSGAIALIPLGMTDLIKKMNSEIRCQEAGWYQQYKSNDDFEVSFLPAQHWHRRGSTDHNKVLWGSFLIKSQGKTIYFGGDSAYAKHFKDIGTLFGEIDIAILPIAAYAPRWFMKSSHMNTKEAMLAYKDLNAQRLIPMHFGTFDLSDEPLGEPERLLKAVSTGKNVTFLNIGEKSSITVESS